MVPVPVRESGEQATTEETSGKVARVPAGGYVYASVCEYTCACVYVPA